MRLGLIALATDLTFERDAARVLPHDRVALHVTRIAFANPTTPENLRAMAPHLAEAASLIAPGTPLAAICFGCTSASALIGDVAVDAAIGTGRPGVPVVTPARAAARAFAALGVRRVALLTPYLEETACLVRDYFAAAGVEVVASRALGSRTTATSPALVATNWSRRRWPPTGPRRRRCSCPAPRCRRSSSFPSSRRASASPSSPPTRRACGRC